MFKCLLNVFLVTCLIQKGGTDDNFASQVDIKTGLETLGISDVSKEINGIGDDIQSHLSPGSSVGLAPSRLTSPLVGRILPKLSSAQPPLLSRLINGAPSRISPPDITREAVVEIRGDPSKFAAGIRGHVTLKQIKNGPVIISGAVMGLPRPGKHGMHFHQVAAPYPGQCQTVGEHYNPYLTDHGSKEHIHHHLGDEGNIDAHGTIGHSIAHIVKTDRFITLEPGAINSVVGLPLVIHLRPDDLGARGDPESRESGHSGDKIACGNVVLTA